MHSMDPDEITISENLLAEHEDPLYKRQVASGIAGIKTYYESKFIEQGMKIHYLAFRLEKDKTISHGWEKAE